MRALAIIATYNEERFIGNCLDHLFAHGLEAYVCDNQSTDRTVEIASRHLGSGLRGLEILPRGDTFRWRPILQRKEELAATLDADWFLHLDPDEVPLPPPGRATLLAGLIEAEAAGANAVQFAELTFVPTREAPDHDHADYRRTMRWYYPFEPAPVDRVRAWKRQPAQVDLVSSGGHVVAFPGRQILPERFRMLHYLFLSREHVTRKYETRPYDQEETSGGWHGWRATIKAEDVVLPSEADLRVTRSETDLDASSPHRQHCVRWSGS